MPRFHQYCSLQYFLVAPLLLHGYPSLDKVRFAIETYHDYLGGIIGEKSHNRHLIGAGTTAGITAGTVTTTTTTPSAQPGTAHTAATTAASASDLSSMVPFALYGLNRLTFVLHVVVAISGADQHLSHARFARTFRCWGAGCKTRLEPRIQHLTPI